MTLNDLLVSLVDKGASDIHLHADTYPMIRIDGQVLQAGDTKLSPAATESLVQLLCDERQQQLFAAQQQIDLSYDVHSVARFRVNLFRQRGAVSAVMRVVKVDETHLSLVPLPPELVTFFRDQEKGLILITGPTGSGKSTTLTRIIDEINRVHNKVIITVEDPIEYLHHNKRSVIVQREIGVDAPSFSTALVAAMRQDPDVIMIGEIRDYATAAAAISAAQTGHLVLSTLHTIDTVRTVNRMIELFPPHERASAQMFFADALVGIVSQRLLPQLGGGRVVAMEIMKGTLRVKDLLRDETRHNELYEAVKDSRLDGMQLFDDALAQLYAQGKIDFSTGFHAATSSQSFKMAATQIDLAQPHKRRPTR
jgi:twitching motility protein PilT